MSSFYQSFEHSRDLAQQFEGMMGDPSIAIFQAFLSYQKAESVTGDLIEFGVYKGKSAAVILNNLSDGEKATLVDIADYPELDKLKTISQAFRFVKGKSEELVLEEDFVSSLGQNVRFSHHDASHSFRNVSVEMEFMQNRLAKRGIIVLDDFGNPNYFQVVAACFHHLAKPCNELAFLLWSTNKAYLCRKEDFQFYERFVIRDLPSLMKEANMNYYLSRTEKSERYSGFSLAKKSTADQFDYYGVNTYGERYYQCS